MVENKIWLNSHIELFDITNTQIEHLDNTQISISGFNENVINSYAKCVIVLSAKMPSKYLLKANKEKRNFDVTLAEFGPRDKYNTEDVIIKLRDCILIDKAMDNVIAIHPNDVEEVDIWAEFSGLIKVIK